VRSVARPGPNPPRQRWPLDWVLGGGECSPSGETR
jgi:hypothetical protein